MLAKAILVHGVIGYKICWLLPSEDWNQDTSWTRIKWHHCQGPLRGHESAETPTRHESNGTTIKDHWEDTNQLRHQLGMNQRDKKPSYSSSEETSLEFDLLEIKITRKQKYKGKAEQVLCRYTSYYDPPPRRITYIGSIIYWLVLYIGSKIYIEKIFSKKYSNNIFDWL